MEKIILCAKKSIKARSTRLEKRIDFHLVEWRKVVQTFLQDGIPHLKLKYFRPLLEKEGTWLVDAFIFVRQCLSTVYQKTR